MSPPESYTGDWITPDHPHYSEAIARWAANAERRAKAVAFVKSAQDVATILKYAKQHNHQIAIRGGGHSSSGASSAEDGIVIDLSRHLSGVRVDPVEKLAYVGGGAIWETVDKAAIEHGLATVGGTVNHTGVGGLLLGGGYGFLSGQHGLALDNLVQATVVTARGEVLTASDAENADLFWGIRGAGCNFGVVTEFVLRLHPQRRTVFAGTVVFPPPMVPKAVAAAADLCDKGLTEKEAIFAAHTTDPAGNPCAFVILFWNGSEEEGRAHFKPFFDLGPVMDSCKEIPYEELNSMQNPYVKHGSSRYLKGVFSKGPQVEVAGNITSRLHEISARNGVELITIFEVISTKKILSVPNKATPHIRGSRISVLIIATWDKDTNKLDAARSATSELSRIIIDGEKIVAESASIGYGNYNSDDITLAAAGTTSIRAKAETLFGENYAKLQKLKKEYDPELVFFKWSPIMPEA